MRTPRPTRPWVLQASGRRVRLPPGATPVLQWVEPVRAGHPRDAEIHPVHKQLQKFKKVPTRFAVLKCRPQDPRHQESGVPTSTRPSCGHLLLLSPTWSPRRYGSGTSGRRESCLARFLWHRWSSCFRRPGSADSLPSSLLVLAGAVRRLVFSVLPTSIALRLRRIKDSGSAVALGHAIKIRPGASLSKCIVPAVSTQSQATCSQRDETRTRRALWRRRRPKASTPAGTHSQCASSRPPGWGASSGHPVPPDRPTTVVLSPGSSLELGPLVVRAGSAE